MGVFEFVTVIVVVACVAGVLKDYLKNQRKAASADGQQDLLDELDRLRERVEVLETIVTDEKYHLEKEIGQLERRA